MIWAVSKIGSVGVWSIVVGFDLGDELLHLCKCLTNADVGLVRS